MNIEQAPRTQPIRSLAELAKWTPNVCAIGGRNCALKKVKRESNEPKLLVCHDMQGGYLLDSLTQGSHWHSETGQPYLFKHWHLTDIFVYFSHERITIPPATWVQVAHRNGTQILGTVITEHQVGCEENILLVHGPDNVLGWSTFYADKLVAVADGHGLDGWLINIESPLKTEHVVDFICFLAYLTKHMQARNPSSVVIWYDSVVSSSGKVNWQDCLNRENEAFFDVCDGIFTNYTWKFPNLMTSLIHARERRFDVFTGIDIWGRNTFGGGGLDTWKVTFIDREIIISRPSMQSGMLD